MSVNLSRAEQYQLGVQLARWRKSPVEFVRRVFSVEPTSQQAEALGKIASDFSKLSIKAGRGPGKTTLDSWVVWWHVCCFEQSKCAVTAPTKAQLQDALVAEVHQWRDRMAPTLREMTDCSTERAWAVGHEKTQFATFRTASKAKPEALQGLHQRHVLAIVDEASGVDDVVFGPLKGATGTESTRQLLTSNPTRTEGYFFQTHNRLAHLWQTMTMSCLDSQIVTTEYIDEMIAEYGEDSDPYRVYVLGQFPRASINQLIPRELVEMAMEVRVNPLDMSYAPTVLGVDVAWEGDDRSVIYLRKGLHSKKLFEQRNVDNITLGGLINQFWDEHKVDAVFIDVGMGTGVIDYLRSIGKDPLPVNFGGASTDPQWANKRSQIWGNMKAWLEAGGQLERSEDMADDLTGPMYFFQPNGKKMLEQKKAMKKRGIKSPDLADALACTFAEEVKKLSLIEEVAGSRPVFNKTEWEVFE